MRNLSVFVKILLPVLGVAAILTTRHFTQVSGPGTSSAKAGRTPAEQETDSIPLCSGGTFPQAPPAGGSKRHSVTLSWATSVPVSNSPRDAIKGYYVYRSQRSQTYADHNRLNSVPLMGTRCLDPAVEPRATYYYVVKAVAEGGAQSAASKEIKAVIPFP